ncbi:hypothetical protein [uncultured Methanolobus sp.]|uniref:hypothetical protein n=1 Tax=uncultured Methanolobus sp. TaxID=218300 RepID=UPI0029C61128|nr:hypothetical protein [uncultured Methanolobus sp.]
MGKIKSMIIIALFLLIAPVSIVSGESGVDYDAYKEKWDLLYEDKNDWVCVDHSVNYARNNPGWSVVILSPSPAFRFQPHMANYKIDGNMLLIHEPQVNLTYELEIVNGSMTVPFYENYPEDFSSQWARPTYFHFIPNETDVVRTYYSLQDNRDEFFDYENMSSNDTINITSEINDTDIMVNNVSSTIANTSTFNDTTNFSNDIENIDEKESYTARFIRFARSIIGIFS